jgi:CubicO group peptidase (beta-lactamase class C family)
MTGHWKTQPAATSPSSARLARVAGHLFRDSLSGSGRCSSSESANISLAAAAAQQQWQGTVAPGWEAVAEAFGANFLERDELGAAVGVVHRGRLVVDIWGGVREPVADPAAPPKPWLQDTLVNVFSSTKGIVALGASILIDRGLLDIAAAVSSYWPEFAAQGKGELTVAQLLSHQGKASKATPRGALSVPFVAFLPYGPCLTYDRCFQPG